MQINLGKSKLRVIVEVSADLKRNPEANKGTHTGRAVRKATRSFAGFLTAVTKEILNPTERDEESS